VAFSACSIAVLNSGLNSLSELLNGWPTLPSSLESVSRLQLSPSARRLGSVRDEEPQLTGRPLYQQVIVRRSGLDPEAATRVLRLACQCFCEWPCERTLRFRDVVQYVAIDEYLRSHLAKLGMHTDMKRVVAQLIAPNL